MALPSAFFFQILHFCLFFFFFGGWGVLCASLLTCKSPPRLTDSSLPAAMCHHCGFFVFFVLFLTLFASCKLKCSILSRLSTVSSRKTSQLPTTAVTNPHKPSGLEQHCCVNLRILEAWCAKAGSLCSTPGVRGPGGQLLSYLPPFYRHPHL